MCVDRREGGITLKALVVGVGARRSLVATAGGVAMLIALPSAERKRIAAECLARLRRSDTAHLDGIAQMLERSESVGYGFNCDDITPGISAIGVSMLNRGRAGWRDNGGGDLERFDERRRRKVLDMLLPEVAKLRGRLLPGITGAVANEAV
ncbi:MAG: hypothetical protein IPQ15_09650 [Betaproteobacteria bacterium]|nr:hypothetical protein [Betaproteobacteria bacterium]